MMKGIPWEPVVPWDGSRKGLSSKLNCPIWWCHQLLSDDVIRTFNEILFVINITNRISANVSTDFVTCRKSYVTSYDTPAVGFWPLSVVDQFIIRCATYSYIMRISVSIHLRYAGVSYASKYRDGQLPLFWMTSCLSMANRMEKNLKDSSLS